MRPRACSECELLQMEHLYVTFTRLLEHKDRSQTCSAKLLLCDGFHGFNYYLVYRPSKSWCQGSQNVRSKPNQQNAPSCFGNVQWGTCSVFGVPNATPNTSQYFLIPVQQHGHTDTEGDLHDPARLLRFKSATSRFAAKEIIQIEFDSIPFRSKFCEPWLVCMQGL